MLIITPTNAHVSSIKLIIKSYNINIILLTFKQLQLQERDRLEIDAITKTEWKEYYRKLWNEQGSKGEEGIEEERRSEGTDDNEDIITTEELNEVLKHAKNRKSCGLDNLPMELWKFGGNELKIHLLELFNKIIDKNQMPQEW